MSWRFEHSMAALKHRNFRLFVPGQFISLLGFWMQNVGQSWLVYRLTHSTAYLGVVTFAQQIPIMLLAIPAGAFVDRTNRHRLVITTQTLALIQAAILTVLTYLGQITISQILILGTLIGIISSFDMPGRQAFLVQMVNREDLTNAIALNSSMFNAARMIGPAIAGFVVAKWGEGFCFLMNAVTYVAVLIALLMMRVPKPETTAKRQSLANDLSAGFRYVRETKAVRAMLQLLGAFGIFGYSFSVLMPVFADQIFGRGAAGLGWLMAATGLGALGGAIMLAGRKGITGISKLIVVGAFGFSACLIVFSFLTHFWIAFCFLILTGFFMMTMVASTNTAIQSLISDTYRGRVMSFFTMTIIGLAPIGSLICGYVAKWVGPQVTVFGSGIFCLGAACWFYRILPSIKHGARQLLTAQKLDERTEVSITS
jgi:MFS family permease